MSKQKSQIQLEQDFKKLVLSMLPEDEKKVIIEIHSSDLWYLVFGAYHPYSATKQIVNTSYEDLDLQKVYRVIMSLRDIKDYLKEETINL